MPVFFEVIGILNAEAGNFLKIYLLWTLSSFRYGFKCILESSSYHFAKVTPPNKRAKAQGGETAHKVTPLIRSRAGLRRGRAKQGRDCDLGNRCMLCFKSLR